MRSDDPAIVILRYLRNLNTVGHFPHDAAQHMTASGTVTSSR
jgi:hypothetical protein